MRPTHKLGAVRAHGARHATTGSTGDGAASIAARATAAWRRRRDRQRELAWLERTFAAPPYRDLPTRRPNS